MQADCPFNVSLGLNSADPVFNEGSTCVVAASFFAASTGAPFTPTSILYRVDDINSGAPIVASTSVTPAPSVSITVTGAQNALLSALRCVEEHQLTVTVEDSYGNVANVPIRWLVKRVFTSIT